MKILVATEKPFAAAAVTGIREVVEQGGHELVLVEKGTKQDMINAIADCAGLIVRSDKVDKEVFDAAPQLKVVVRAGAGYDNIDLDEATKHGVCVMNTPGQNANAVADHPQPLQRHFGYRAQGQDSGYSCLWCCGSQRGTHR